MQVPDLVKSISGTTAIVLVVLLVVAGAVFRPVQFLSWVAAGAVAIVGIINTLSYGNR